jgi:hypothetical protein
MKMVALAAPSLELRTAKQQHSENATRLRLQAKLNLPNSINGPLVEEGSLKSLAQRAPR